jgi:hypothetical protein
MQQAGIPSSSNGAAFTHVEVRDGVPLDYVGEKLERTIKELHRLAGEIRSGEDTAATIREVMRNALTAHLALHNMLAAAGDTSLSDRFLASNRGEIEGWLLSVYKGGDVCGLAGIGGSSGAPA